jgi:hypothetical protein
MSIIIYGEIKITVNGDYSPKAIDEEGKKWSIHRSSFMKNSGICKVRRYVRAGMKFDAEIIEDWRKEPRGEFQGVIRFKEK